MDSHHFESLQKEVAELHSLVMEQQKRIHTLEKKASLQAQSFSDSYVRERVAPVQHSPATNFISHTETQEKKKNDFELKVGIYYLSRLGIIGLFLGIAFFLKYSFDNNWVGPLGRVLIGYVSGVILLGLGEYFRKKYTAWSMVFTGGGLAIFYLSTFAAESYYHLIPQEASLMLMSLITVGTGFLSIKRSSFVIALFGLIGGFLTPLLSSVRLDDYPYVVLFYLLILNIGVLGVSFFKKWKYLDPLAFLFTVLYFTSLLDNLSRLEATVMACMYFLIFSLSIFNQIYHVGRQAALSEGKQGEVQALGVLYILSNAVFFYSTLLWVWEGERSEYLGAVAFGLAGLYFLKMQFISKVGSLRALYQPVFLAIIFSFLLIGIFRMFELYEGWVTLLWGVFGTGVIIGGLYFKNGWARLQGFCVLGVAFLRYLSVDSAVSRSSDIAILNTLFIVGGILTLCLFILYREYTKPQHLSPDEKKMSLYLGGGANIMLLIIGGRELLDFIHTKQLAQVLLSIAMGIQAGALIAFGFLRQSKEVRWFGLALFGVVVLKVMFIDMSGLDTLYRVAAFIVVGILLILASYLYQRMEKKS